MDAIDEDGKLFIIFGDQQMVKQHMAQVGTCMQIYLKQVMKWI